MERQIPKRKDLVVSFMHGVGDSTAHWNKQLLKGQIIKEPRKLELVILEELPIRQGVSLELGRDNKAMVDWANGKATEKTRMATVS